MSKPKETPARGTPIGPWLVVLTILLLVGLIYLGTRNLFSGVILNPPQIVGEWQAYRTPWRMTFNADKTITNSTGTSDNSQPWTTGPGTYSIDYFGTLWVTLDNGKVYTATLRPELPNQFDLIESATDVVTVFERVQRAPLVPDQP